MKYHSGLGKQYIQDYESIERFETKNILAFYNDITDLNIPNEAEFCDVIYTEIAWKIGLKKFNDRAEKNTQFNDYCNAVSYYINTINKPTVIIAGVNDKKWLPEPKQTIKTQLNKGNVIAYVYNCNVFKHKNTLGILNELSKRYQCCYDFCCGYGNTAIPFLNNGKKAILSDYNKKCIGYIKQLYTNENL